MIAALTLINTPLQRGAGDIGFGTNRFNGLANSFETVETVSGSAAARFTQLKQGVNAVRIPAFQGNFAQPVI